MTDKDTFEMAKECIDIYEEALQRYMGHGITALFNALVFTFLLGFFFGAVVSIGIFAFQMNRSQNMKLAKLTKWDADWSVRLG